MSWWSFERGFSPIAVRVVGHAARPLAEDRIRLALRLELVGARRDDGSRRGYCSIELRSRSEYFGGARWYLACPHCEQRRTHLYLVGVDLTCRECGGLTYRSRAKYGESSRRGEGWSALSLLMDQNDGKVARIQRATYRRWMHNQRKRHAAHAEQYPVLMTGAAQASSR